MSRDDMSNMLRNNLHTIVVFKFPSRPIVTKLSTTILFDIGLT